MSRERAIAEFIDILVVIGVSIYLGIEIGSAVGLAALVWFAIVIQIRKEWRDYREQN